MSEKFMEKAQIFSQEQIADGIYSMWLCAGQIAKAARPGQFVSVYSKDKSRLLPRPVSLCEIDREKGKIRLVYRVAGAGTEEFSHCTAGDTLELFGPLGNGFPLERCPAGKRAFLIGGGIGIPPMVQLAAELEGEVLTVVGYRDETFLAEELSRRGSFFFATESGRAGTKGNVLDCIRENHLEADVIYACGPAPMLRALKTYAAENGMECWVSMEERMACGIGACLACVCRSKEIDSHSQVHNKRICKDGPVFRADEIEI